MGRRESRLTASKRGNLRLSKLRRAISPGTLSQVSAFFDARPEVDVVFGDVLVTDRNGKGDQAIDAPSFHQPNISCLSHLNTFTSATFPEAHSRTGALAGPEMEIDRGFYLDSRNAGGRRALDCLSAIAFCFHADGSQCEHDNPISDQEKQKWLTEMLMSSARSSNVACGATSPPEINGWRLSQANLRLRNLYSRVSRSQTSSNRAWSRRNVEDDLNHTFDLSDLWDLDDPLNELVVIRANVVELKMRFETVPIFAPHSGQSFRRGRAARRACSISFPQADHQLETESRRDCHQEHRGCRASP